MRRLAEKILTTFHGERKRHLKEPRFTTARAKESQNKNTSYATSSMTATPGPKGAGHFASTSPFSQSTAPQGLHSAHSVLSSGHDLELMRGVCWVSASAPNTSARAIFTRNQPTIRLITMLFRSFFICPQSEQGLGQPNALHILARGAFAEGY